MEIRNDCEPSWLNPAHPNFERWKRGRELASARGKFIRSVILQSEKCSNLSVLDLGSGEGGTAQILAEDNFVVSFDISKVRLTRQAANHIRASQINGDGLHLPFKNNSFDLVIVQDVVEHVSNAHGLIVQIKHVLKNGGILFLSTPNKYSLLNLLADPHWGLPFVSILKRETIRKYFLKYFRKSDYNRADIAQLLSLKELWALLKNDFDINLETRFVLSELLNGNKGIVWSDFHLTLVNLAKKINLNKLLIKIANDGSGFTNRFLTPSFYFVLKRK